MPPGAKNSWRVGRARVEVSEEAIGTVADSILLRRWPGWCEQILCAPAVMAVTIGSLGRAEVTLWF